MPVSTEQAEGPKNVKLVFENPLKKPELVNVPHWYALPVLKLQCPRVIGIEGSHKPHGGNDVGICETNVSPPPLESVSTFAPSKLYSFAHLVFSNTRTGNRKKRKMAKYLFTYFIAWEMITLRTNVHTTLFIVF